MNIKLLLTLSVSLLSVSVNNAMDVSDISHETVEIVDDDLSTLDLYNETIPGMTLYLKLMSGQKITGYDVFKLENQKKKHEPHEHKCAKSVGKI
jgi:hypothetical protein